MPMPPCFLHTATMPQITPTRLRISPATGRQQQTSERMPNTSDAVAAPWDFAGAGAAAGVTGCTGAGGTGGIVGRISCVGTGTDSAGSSGVTGTAGSSGTCG